MKTFIKDVKWMFRCDKETFKMIGITFIFALLISFAMFRVEDGKIFLLLNIVPFVLFSMAYFGRYRPIFREIEKEVDLELKYSFLYERFTKGEGNCYEK